MKKFIFFLFLLSAIQILIALPQALAEIQKQVAIQAGEFQNSPTHQMIRKSQGNRSYNVGDVRTFWRWNLSVMPPTWVQTPATCRAVGEHSYVFVADSEWNVHMTQANVDTIMVRLEDRTMNDPTMGAIEMDIQEFGPIPDELDNDPKVIVFYSALGSFQGSQFDGYFSSYNQVTEAEAQQMNPPGHSNLCEMIYMTCYPLSPVAPVRLSVLAHELTHMIEWGLDPNEETWIDEGCAELAMVKYGVPDPITGFNTTPDNDLTSWNQTFADYVKVMLFFTYLSEHYDATGLIRDIIADPANGVASVSNQINTYFPNSSFTKIFRDWTVANFLDTQQADLDVFHYSQLNLPAFGTTFQYSQAVLNVSNSGTVQPWAADYIKVLQNMNLRDGEFQGNQPFLFTDIAIPTNTAEPIQVNHHALSDSTEWLSYSLDGTYVLVIANPSGTPLNYSFTIATGVSNDDSVTPVQDLTITCFPNPLISGSEPMNIQINNVKMVDNSEMVSIYNVKGQLVDEIMLQNTRDGNSLSASWNGRDEIGRTAASGVYFVRYRDGSKTLNKKFMIIR